MTTSNHAAVQAAKSSRRKRIERMILEGAKHVGNLRGTPSYMLGAIDGEAKGIVEGRVMERVNGLVESLADNDIHLSFEEIERLEQVPLAQLPPLKIAQSSRSREEFWRESGLAPSGS